MSGPKTSGDDLHEAFISFSNEVFSATQRLLTAQQQLTQEILSGASRGAGESEQETVAADDETGAEDGTDDSSDDAAEEQSAVDVTGEDLPDEDMSDDDVSDEDTSEEDVVDEGIADEDQDDQDIDQDAGLDGPDDEEPAEDSDEAPVVAGDVGSRRPGRGRRR
jgi:hypothetical protein